MLDKEILVNNWLFKSDEALKDAKKNLELDMLSNAQNRLYYAVFYAICALGQKNGFITSKHGQLLGWFNREYLKSNLVDRNTARIYKKSFEFRQKSDYTTAFKPDKQVLTEDVEKAEIFIKIIRQLITEQE
jgi:uncharacterized protein (UPF0332 family)